MVLLRTFPFRRNPPAKLQRAVTEPLSPAARKSPMRKWLPWHFLLRSLLSHFPAGKPLPGSVSQWQERDSSWGRLWGRNTAFPRISTPHLLLLYPSALQQCLTTGLTSAMCLLPHVLASGTSGSSGMCFITPLHHQNVLTGTQSSACKLERDQHPSHATCTLSGGLGHLGWSPAAWEITRSWGDMQGGEFYPHCRAPQHQGRTLHHPGQRCFLCY